VNGALRLAHMLLRYDNTYLTVVHRAYTPNDLLLLFIKDLLVMGNQYFWWAGKI
jgi:hypothetical protein